VYISKKCESIHLRPRCKILEKFIMLNELVSPERGLVVGGGPGASKKVEKVSSLSLPTGGELSPLQRYARISAWNMQW
jgi:hypothetical protein